jgi:hypothetical protein
MSIANVADTKIGRDMVSLILGTTDVVMVYASASRNIDIRTENLKSVKEFWDYDVAIAGGATLEVEVDVRDEDVLLGYLDDVSWCECPYQIVFGNGDSDSGTAVITKANHSAPGEGKQKFSYTLKLRPST